MLGSVRGSRIKCFCHSCRVFSHYVTYSKWHAKCYVDICFQSIKNINFNFQYSSRIDLFYFFLFLCLCLQSLLKFARKRLNRDDMPKWMICKTYFVISFGDTFVLICWMLDKMIRFDLCAVEDWIKRLISFYSKTRLSYLFQFRQ